MVKRRESRNSPVLPELRTETQNVSNGGLFFVASPEWKVGTEIQCELHLTMKIFAGRSLAIQCRGRIVRHVPQEEGRVAVGATIDHYELFQLER